MKISGENVDEKQTVETKKYSKKNRRKNSKPRAIESVFDWVDSFVVSLVVVIVMFTFFLGKVEVDGGSMNDTLIDRDQLIISDFNYTPKNGDIVIISRNYSNSEEAAASSDLPIVKRIIATAGQTVEIKDDAVFVNDERLEESYCKNKTMNKGFVGKQTVPEGCVFVLGDNRENSHDSRSSDIGFVNTKYILGKVLLRIFPFDSFTVFN